MPELSNVDPVAVQKRYPYVIDFDDDTLATLLACTILEAEEDVSEQQFGDLRERAIVALTAHKMLLHAASQSGDNNAQQILSAYSADGVSGTFLVTPPDGIAPESMHYYTTQPGVDYMELARRIGTGVRLV